MSVNFFLNVLKDEGYEVEKDHKILDFGCGNGNFVKKLRDKGYDAYGCDLKFKEGQNVKFLTDNNIINTISMQPYRLPYDDNSFDIVLSETVFEHVQNTDETIAEIYRILKPGGVSLHYFPSKYGVIESHVYIPFASVFNSFWYLKLWALIGVRKKKQMGMSAHDIAIQNKKYLDSSTKYLSTKEIRDAFSQKFSNVRFVEKAAIPHSPSRMTSMWAPLLPILPFLSWVFRTFKAVVLLTKK